MNAALPFQKNRFEHVVIGGGPAAICAIAKLLSSGISGNVILWIDPQFSVGDFGTKLSRGSSVPGNTTVESYQLVNEAIYNLIPACRPTPEKLDRYLITSLAFDTTCTLDVATAPLKDISHQLRQIVFSQEGTVHDIIETSAGLTVNIEYGDKSVSFFNTKRVLLATGATPKTIDLPLNITQIDSSIAFIQSELENYLLQNPKIKKVAVVGSSHSAALAVMHLLQAGIEVKQFMNKDYKYAEVITLENGERFTQFDNTGLKGQVAAFTKNLSRDLNLSAKWQKFVGQGDNHLRMHLDDCTHAVVAIGYYTSPSLRINNVALSTYHYDKKTSQLLDSTGAKIPGIFGIGIAFPAQVTDASGETEFAVGVGKFWKVLTDKVLQYWQQNAANTDL